MEDPEGIAATRAAPAAIDAVNDGSDVPPANRLRVSSTSKPNAVAGAMAGVVRESGGVDVQVVGAGALNQAIKALAIARSYLASDDVDLVCVPYFADIEIDGERRTAIRLRIADRRGPFFAAGTHTRA